MRILLTRPLTTVVLLLGIVLARPLPSWAQFGFNPNQAAATAARTQAVANAATQSFLFNPFQFGYGLSGPGTNPYYGYLSGAAEVTNANAQYQLTTQQARVVKQQ